MDKIFNLKQLRSIMLVMLCAFLCTTFVACSDDDEDEPLTTQQMLEGSWNFNGGDASFSSNGQFQMNYNQANISGTWVMDGDEWIIVSLSKNEFSTSNMLYFQIISLNKDNISLKMFQDRDENGNGIGDVLLDITMNKSGNNNSDNSSIVGVWKYLGNVYYADKECTIELGRESGDNEYYEFKKDGTYVCYDEGGEIYFIGKYKYDSKKKKLTVFNGYKSESASVLSLTSTTLVTLAYDEDWVKATLKRVSAVGE